MPVGAPNCNSHIFRDLREYYHEGCASELKERSYSAGVAGKYVCSRCGWRWTPRTNSPDPPRACARCRSAYWQSTPVSCRANSPSDPNWCVESQSVARRRQKRHLTRLKELAAEFGFALPPVRYDLSVAHRFSRCHKGRLSRWSQGYISTSPFRPAKIIGTIADIPTLAD